MHASRLAALAACNNAPSEVASPELPHPVATPAQPTPGPVPPTVLATVLSTGPVAAAPVTLKRAMLAITGLR